MGAFEATAFEATAFYVPEEEPPVVATGSPAKGFVVSTPLRDDDAAIAVVIALMLEPF
jgi:hypothetical protein